MVFADTPRVLTALGGGLARGYLEAMSDKTTSGLAAADRAVLRVGGAGAREFLQGLVTNDVRRLEVGGAAYAALLSPQGKYLFDFFLVADGPEDALVDVKADRAAALAQRLAMYRLRAPVTIAPAGLEVALGLGPAPEGPRVAADPRDPALGWRAYVPDAGAFVRGMVALEPAVLTALRVERGVPETGVELIPDDSYILEMGFERLNGVDFRKGCYVGQEVVSRMEHRGTARTRTLILKTRNGFGLVGGLEVRAGEQLIGRAGECYGSTLLAQIRTDKLSDATQSNINITAGGVELDISKPEYAKF